MNIVSRVSQLQWNLSYANLNGERKYPYRLKLRILKKKSRRLQFNTYNQALHITLHPQLQTAEEMGGGEGNAYCCEGIFLTLKGAVL